MKTVMNTWLEIIFALKGFVEVNNIQQLETILLFGWIGSKKQCFDRHQNILSHKIRKNSILFISWNLSSVSHILSNCSNFFLGLLFVASHGYKKPRRPFFMSSSWPKPQDPIVSVFDNDVLGLYKFFTGWFYIQIQKVLPMVKMKSLLLWILF